MKKYLFFCMAMIALLFASCKNEDISISREVSFNVNPSTVVKDFAKYEYKPGDMSSVFWFDIGDRLRVQLFLFDANGYLVERQVRYVDGYDSSVSFDRELSDGRYTVLAVTDEVGLSGSSVTDEYWIFSGTERLDNLKITDSGWSDGRFKKLGITSQSITVRPGQTVFNIDVKAAGAMVHSWIYNIHGFNDVEEYSLWMTRKNGNFSFNSDGSYEVGSEHVNFTRNLREDVPSDYTASNIYGYNFIAPFGNTGFRWEVKLSDGYYYIMLQEEYMSVKAEKCYGCYLNINGNNSSFVFVDLDNGKGMPAVEDAIEIPITKEMAAPRSESAKPNVVKHLE